MIAQILGLIGGIVIGYIVGQNIKFKSKRNLILVTIIIPIILWLFVTFDYLIMSDKLNEADKLTEQWSLHNITFGDRLAHSLGAALGKFFFGYLALGITFYRVGIKKIHDEK